MVFIYNSQMTDVIDYVFLWASWLFVYLVYSRALHIFNVVLILFVGK